MKFFTFTSNLFLLTLLLSALVFLFNNNNAVSATTCPCKDPSLCRPVKLADPNRKELFVFHPGSAGYKNIWNTTWNWSHITTVAYYGELNAELYCYAHSRNVRVVSAVGVNPKILTNASARSEWISEKMMYLRQNNLDGFNTDFEFDIKAGSPASQGLTQLLTDLKKEMGPEVQLSLDVSSVYSPHEARGYDYVALSKVLDFFVIMFYDMFGCGGRNPCIVGANSPLPEVERGLQSWLSITSANKLIGGFPWYGHRYECLNDPSKNPNHACYLDGKQWHAPSDTELNYDDIVRIARGEVPCDSRISALKVNMTESSASFSYYDVKYNKFFQVWFDTPATLTQKYTFAKNQKLRGVSMWHGDSVNVNDGGPRAATDAAAIWNSINSFFF